FKGLAATVGNVTVAAPRCLGIVKAGPHAAHHNLVRMMAAHVAVEVFQVIFAPVAAIVGPSAFSRLHPGIKTVKCIWEFLILVLIDEQWRVRPSLRGLAGFVPVSAGVLGKNKDHRLAVVTALRIAR